MKYSLKALALCAVHADKTDRAIRLYGFVSSRDWLLWPMEMPWLVPFDLDALLEPAHRASRDGRYDRIFAEGQAMSPETAVTYGLESQLE